MVALSIVLPVQAVEPDGSTWLWIRGEDLAGRRLVVENGGIHSTTYWLGGADSTRDGLWIPIAIAPSELPELQFHPPLESPPEVMVLSVPRSLPEGWSIIPLPLSAWGVGSVGELESLRLSGRRGRWRAGSIVRRADGPVECPDAEKATPAPSFAFPLAVADFEGGLLEPLGNRYGAFEGRGASIVTERVRSDGGTRLRITAEFPKNEGFGGVWFQLGPPEQLADGEAGIELREAGAVVVRGRGVARGTVGLSDVAASRRDESVKIGRLSSPETAEWTVVLPIDRRKLDLSRLRSIVINLTGSGSGAIEIDEILLVEDPAAIPPPRRPAVSDVTLEHEAGTWIWNTRDLLDPQSPVRSLLENSIRKWDLTEVYLQIPHDGGGVTFEEWGVVDEPERMADLVRWIHGLGVQVHALDGASYLALPEARSELMAIAAGVAEYNRRVPPESRFDALHMDIEPYLLPAWSGPRREELLRHLGSSIPEMRERSKLPVWLDIPFWFDSVSEERSPERGTRAGCARRDLLEALFCEADGVGIMAYRTKADGAGGIASAAMTEAGLAKEHDRPFRVGVETIDLDRESGWRMRPGKEGVPAPGKPIALVPRGGPASGLYVLFREGPVESDLAWLREHADQFEMFELEYEEGVSPDVITFWGRSADEVRQESEEAIRLLRRSGLRADGIAYHELRTLPD